MEYSSLDDTVEYSNEHSYESNSSSGYPGVGYQRTSPDNTYSANYVITKTLLERLEDPRSAYDLGMVITPLPPEAMGEGVLGAQWDNTNMTDTLDTLTYSELNLTKIHEFGHRIKPFRNPHGDGSTYDEEWDNRRWLASNPHSYN
ncbi:MAG: hypothetical protein AABX59_02180 [Nanoarchaeota archaeon]